MPRNILTPQQQLQSWQETYDHLVHHPWQGLSEKELQQHRAACREALAAKRAAAEKLRQPPGRKPQVTETTGSEKEKS